MELSVCLEKAATLCPACVCLPPLLVPDCPCSLGVLNLYHLSHLCHLCHLCYLSYCSSVSFITQVSLGVNGMCNLCHLCPCSMGVIPYCRCPSCPCLSPFSVYVSLLTELPRSLIYVICVLPPLQVLSAKKFIYAMLCVSSRGGP